MKKLLAFLLALIAALAVTACGSDRGETETGSGDADSGTPSQQVGTDGPAELIELTVGGSEEDQALLGQLVEEFQAAHPQQPFHFTIEAKTGIAARTAVMKEGEQAADVFAFSYDLLDGMVTANALLPLDEKADAALLQYAGKSLEDVMGANVASAADSTKREDIPYAFPMGGGNNYILFYDSAVLSPEEVQSWDTLLASAQAAGKQVGMALEHGLYTSSFFLGAGFTTQLRIDSTTDVDFEGTSADGFTGVQVLQSMLELTASPAFANIPRNKLHDTLASGSLCAVVMDTGDAAYAQSAFGAGYAAAKLPTFTCNGEQVQQGCFSTFEMVGVNAQSEHADWAVALAEFLTSEDAQLARFESSGMVPTNRNAAASELVAASAAASAAALQDQYAAPPSVGTNYWDASTIFGRRVAQQDIASDDGSCQIALDCYVEEVEAPCG